MLLETQSLLVSFSQEETRERQERLIIFHSSCALHMGVVSMQESRSLQQWYSRKWAQVCKLSSPSPGIFESPKMLWACLYFHSLSSSDSLWKNPCEIFFRTRMVLFCQSRDELWKCTLAYDLGSFSPVACTYGEILLSANCTHWALEGLVLNRQLGVFLESSEHLTMAQDVPAWYWPRQGSWGIEDWYVSQCQGECLNFVSRKRMC